MSLYDKLQQLGIQLPPVSTPAAAYVPFVQTGKLVFLSGHIARKDGKVWVGKLGAGMSTAEGAQAARAIAIDLMGTLQAACDGDLERVVRVVKLGGFVNSTADFTDQPKVINGASDFMVAVLGDAGRHARAAVSAPSLPLGVAVEIDAIFEIA